MEKCKALTGLAVKGLTTYHPILKFQITSSYSRYTVTSSLISSSRGDVHRLTWQVHLRQHDLHVFLQRPNPMMPVKLFFTAADRDDRCIGQLATVMRSLLPHTCTFTYSSQLKRNTLTPNPYKNSTGTMQL